MRRALCSQRSDFDTAETESPPLAHGLARGDHKSFAVILIHVRDRHIPHQSVEVWVDEKDKAVNIRYEVLLAKVVYAERKGGIAAAAGLEINPDGALCPVFIQEGFYGLTGTGLQLDHRNLLASYSFTKI
jgi:hypothetical protein